MLALVTVLPFAKYIAVGHGSTPTGEKATRYRPIRLSLCPVQTAREGERPVGLTTRNVRVLLIAVQWGRTIV